jgi:hypothetical protein
MNTSARFFTEKLYPFQDGILSLVKRSGTPFYLTGGTALAGRWFGHRFSEDLDLFVHPQSDYAVHVDELFETIRTAEKRGMLSVDRGRLRRSPRHTQLYVATVGGVEPIELRIDLVNDTAPLIGDSETDPVLGLADIWVIARDMSFHWRDAISDAQLKEGAVDPISVHGILRSVPENELAHVLWFFTIDAHAVASDLAAIAEDIFHGRSDSLHISQ